MCPLSLPPPCRILWFCGCELDVVLLQIEAMTYTDKDKCVKLALFVAGKVHWKEYYVHFLLAKGYKQDIATRHVVDYDQIQLDPDCESALLTYLTFMHLIVNFTDCNSLV